MIEITFEFYPYILKGLEPVIANPESVSIQLSDMYRKYYNDIFDSPTLHIAFSLDKTRLTELAPFIGMDTLKNTLVRISFKESDKITTEENSFRGYIALAKMLKGYKIYSEPDSKGNFAALNMVDLDMIITGICDEDWQTLVG